MTSDGIVLAFDTATEAIALGVGIRSGSTVDVLGTRDFQAPRAAMSGLLPAIEVLLGDLSLAPADVSEVVVGRGPGSFTGVRIGVATAKGIAHGLGVGLFGVGTLDAIAWGVPREWSGTLGVVGDAMRGEVYPAVFDLSQSAEGRTVARRDDDCVAVPGSAAQAWARLDEPMFLAGNGLIKYAEVFSDALGEGGTLAPTAWWSPTGAGLLRAFAATLRTGAGSDGRPGLVLPVYTRLSDAEEAERTRAGLGPMSLPATGVGGTLNADPRASSGTSEPPA